MNLPLDIPALISAATDIDAARNTPLAVSVYLDETAPGDMVGHVRSAFASAGARTRVTLGYLDDGALPEPYGADDMAVIVAGDDPAVGAQAAAVRAAGTPAMVATVSPHAVRARAEAAGSPIPAGDVAAPDTPAPAADGTLAPELADAARDGLITPQQLQLALRRTDKLLSIIYKGAFEKLQKFIEDYE